MASGEPFAKGPFELSPDEVLRRKSFLEFSEDDEKLLRDAHPHVVSRVDGILERFYEFLLSHPATQELLAEPGRIERLKKMQTLYLLELTSGTYDLEYFENRLRVGLAHERVGLSPDLYLGAYEKYFQLVAEALRPAYGEDLDRFRRTCLALRKIISLDMSLAIDAYNHSAQERLRQKAAELAKANEDLQKLDVGKRRLTDMIVHDLQNPLAGIVAFLRTLEDKDLSEEEHFSVGEALSRCGDLSRLILNVLQLSRAEEGKLELFVEEVDASDVARRAAAAFSLVAERGGRRLALDTSDRPVPLRTDPGLLSRILENLIRNALRHTPEGTQVVVRVSPGPPARLSVHDDGPGISSELQDKIFEPFSSRALRKGVSSDSGLGLSFCKMAADALGFDILLESTPGEGCDFVLEAPIRGLDA